MKLTLKKLVWVTLASLVLTVVKLMWVDKWISPSDIKFWANDIAVLIAWVLYFLEKNKK